MPSLLACIHESILKPMSPICVANFVDSDLGMTHDAVSVQPTKIFIVGPNGYFFKSSTVGTTRSNSAHDPLLNLNRHMPTVHSRPLMVNLGTNTINTSAVRQSMRDVWLIFPKRLSIGVQVSEQFWPMKKSPPMVAAILATIPFLKRACANGQCALLPMRIAYYKILIAWIGQNPSS